MKNPYEANAAPLSTKVVGVIFGIVIGIIVVSIVEKAGHLLYPPAEEIDFAEPDSLVRFMENLPMGALVVVLLAHGLGSFLGAFTIFFLVKAKWWTGPLIVGALLNVAGVINLVLLPHPQWFVVTDLILYIPLALIGGRLGMATVGKPNQLPEKDFTNSKSEKNKTKDDK